MKKKVKNTDSRLKVIPLGGLEQIGLNITAFEYEDSILVVDCGLSFPADDMLGIDLVIPDVSYLLEHSDKVKGFVITHGHEDHIGALPYVLKMINVQYQRAKSLLEEHREGHNALAQLLIEREVIFAEDVERIFGKRPWFAGNYHTGSGFFWPDH